MLPSFKKINKIIIKIDIFIQNSSQKFMYYLWLKLFLELAYVMSLIQLKLHMYDINMLWITISLGLGTYFWLIIFNLPFSSYL